MAVDSEGYRLHADDLREKAAQLGLTLNAADPERRSNLAELTEAYERQAALFDELADVTEYLEGKGVSN